LDQEKREQEAKESLWREEQNLAQFREAIKYIFNQENVGKDEFIKSLILVQDVVDRQ
jgi:hypothetical protein